MNRYNNAISLIGNSTLKNKINKSKLSTIPFSNKNSEAEGSSQSLLPTSLTQINRVKIRNPRIHSIILFKAKLHTSWWSNPLLSKRKNLKARMNLEASPRKEPTEGTIQNTNKTIS